MFSSLIYRSAMKLKKKKVPKPYHTKRPHMKRNHYKSDKGNHSKLFTHQDSQI